MPPKKKKCLRRSQAEHAARMAAARASQNAEELEIARSQNAARMAAARVSQTDEELEIAQHQNAARMAAARVSQHAEDLEITRSQNARRMAAARASQTDEESEIRRCENAARMAAARLSQWRQTENSAFRYQPDLKYEEHKSAQIGKMSITCNFCQALKWKGETPGLCCSNGKVRLPDLDTPPEPLLTMLTGDSAAAKDFQSNIRRYNACFQMTSFGATRVVREPGFMPTFTVQGQVYHGIGSLLPENDGPKFLQIYFVGDQQQQAELRCQTISDTNRGTVFGLQEMLRRENNYVQSFQCAMEHMTPELRLVIHADRTPAGEHVRRFNAPATSEVAVILAGEQHGTRDIVLHLRNATIQKIAETHRAYDALQYPLMFWKGDDGYHFELKQTDPRTGMETRKKISAMDFYASRLMQRTASFNMILRCKELSHQFIVDMFAKIESERLRFIYLNQKKLRVEDYVHLRDAINGDQNVSNLGQLVILPSTFTGGPRYMHERTQDAMTYVRNFGRPDLFITFTCNPKWTEIKEELMPRQRSTDRHDLVARVFHLKLKAMMDLLNKGKIFGEVRCYMYTVEWQKRGLPHAHILVWFQEKIQPHRVDEFISSEIPNPQVDSALHNIVKTQMIHGPCGNINPNSPCMKEGKCTKRYPRNFLKETQTGRNGYPLYRRRSPEDGGSTTTLRIGTSDIEVDNRWVVPYCPLLSRLFNAHINIEYCHSIKSIKYVCKYVNKGSDMAVFGLAGEQSIQNEVHQYQIGRYISTNEATWRILSFPIHERHPTVVHLAVHLENGQRVYFTEETARARAQAPQHTTLTAFFTLCQEDEFARTLFYHQVPRYYTWNASTKKWSRRKQGQVVQEYVGVRSSDAIGRVYTVHPNNSECFHLRLLLHEVLGPTSFDDLKTVDDTVSETYKQACVKRGLLENDDQWRFTLEEAADTRSPGMLRNLFAVILQTCSVSNPLELWIMQRENMSEDILHRSRLQTRNNEMEFDNSIFNQALIIIEDKIQALGGSDLKHFGLPEPQRDGNQLVNSEVMKETSYNAADLEQFIQLNEPKLVVDQRKAYDNITSAVFEGREGIFFLDAPGGTGKTFLLNLILAKVRQQKMIALAVASSGLAATLLTGGRTAHSAFKLPFALATTESPTCNISRSCDKAEVFRKTRLIVWDECTMSHKAAFEALNTTMQDLARKDSLFAGAVLVMSGDFRQTLPVVRRGTRADQIQACIKASPIWRRVQLLGLKTNMRVLLTGDISTQAFAANLLRLGNGQVPSDIDDGTISMENIGKTVTTIDQLKESVFPDIARNFVNNNWLCERAILAPTNDAVHVINKELLSKLPGPVRMYKSLDVVLNTDDAVHYTPEFLNKQEISGVPQHILELKIGAPIILLRNLDPPTLCNGTRLTVKKLMAHCIECTIMTGHAAGSDVFIPRIPVIPTDIPFQFKRLQFPVCLSFAMSINKAQGQSLKVVGLNLLRPCFSHGQLYVGCSRVGDNNNLFILTPNGRTKNIVYQEVLQRYLSR